MAMTDCRGWRSLIITSEVPFPRQDNSLRSETEKGQGGETAGTRAGFLAASPSLNLDANERPAWSRPEACWRSGAKEYDDCSRGPFWVCFFFLLPRTIVPEAFFIAQELNNASALGSPGGRSAAITLKPTCDYQPLVLKQLHSLHSGPPLRRHKTCRCEGTLTAVSPALFPAGCRKLSLQLKREAR